MRAVLAEDPPRFDGVFAASDSIAMGVVTALKHAGLSVPDTIADPTFFTYRAALLLAVGRSDEASRDVERALSLRAGDSAAYGKQALFEIIEATFQLLRHIARVFTHAIDGVIGVARTRLGAASIDGYDESAFHGCYTLVNI